MRLPTVSELKVFAREIRTPAAYKPVVTELKGITNLVAGSLELFTSQYMKYSSNKRLNGQSSTHLQLANRTLKVGFTQAAPGLLLGLGAVYLVRKALSYLETEN